MLRLDVNFLKFICLLYFFCNVLFYNTNVSAKKVDQLYKKAANQYHRLYQNSDYRKYEHNWLRTIRQFEKIYQSFPHSVRAPQSLYNIGKLYKSLYKWNRKISNIHKSNFSLKKILKKYKKSYLADDAQWMLAENFELYEKNKNLAYIEYQRLIRNFPNSLHVKYAKKKVKELKPTDDSVLNIPLSDGDEILGDIPTKIKYGGLSEKEIKNQKKVLVSKVDYWTTNQWSRVVIETKDAIRYKYQILGKDTKNKKGVRFYMDLYNTYIPPKFKRLIHSNDGILKRIRVASFDKKTTRVVLDFVGFKKLKVFDFKFPKHNKIVLDISGSSFAEEDLQVFMQKKDIQNQNHNHKPYIPKKKKKGRYKPSKDSLSLTDALNLKIKTIVIDPGHGGRDPGAIGHGLQEKHIVLAIAKKVKSIFQKRNSDLNVFLTREKDYFINLEARTAFANQKNADLFVSIHANASEDHRVHGIETYFLNLTTDHSSLALAAKENQSTKKSVSDLQGILYDLMTDVKIHESSELAGVLQKSMVTWSNKARKEKVRSLGVKQAPFIVLVGAKMPSILIEVGFLTHLKESSLFKSKRYISKISEGIYHGILNYIKQANNASLAIYPNSP